MENQKCQICSKRYAIVEHVVNSKEIQLKVCLCLECFKSEVKAGELTNESLENIKKTVEGE